MSWLSDARSSMPARRSSRHRRPGLLACWLAGWVPGWLVGWVAGTDEPPWHRRAGMSMGGRASARAEDSRHATVMTAGGHPAVGLCTGNLLLLFVLYPRGPHPEKTSPDFHVKWPYSGHVSFCPGGTCTVKIARSQEAGMRPWHSESTYLSKSGPAGADEVPRAGRRCQGVTPDRRAAQTQS